MCRQAEQAGHTGVCLGRGAALNISPARSTGCASSRCLLPSAALWEDVSSPHAADPRCCRTGMDRAVRSFAGHTSSVVSQLEAVCSLSVPHLYAFSSWHFPVARGAHTAPSCVSLSVLNSLQGSRLGGLTGLTVLRGGLSTAGMRALHSSPISIPGMRAALFWWWCQSNHSCAVGDKEVQRSAAQPTFNECL